MFILQVSLLVSITLAAVKGDAASTTYASKVHNTKVSLNHVLTCLFSGVHDRSPSHFKKIMDEIQAISKALNRTSSTDDTKELQNRITILVKNVDYKIKQLHLELERLEKSMGTLNASTVKLGKTNADGHKNVMDQVSSLKTVLQGIMKTLREQHLDIQKIHGTTVKSGHQLSNQEALVASPNAYILKVKKQTVSAYSENHHCLLELEGWGYEDPGYRIQRPYIRMNGRTVALPARRGVLIITLRLKNHRCTLWTTKAYDTYLSESEANALDALLKGLPIGTGIAVVTNDEFIRHFRRPAEILRKHYGIHLNTAKDENSMWLRSAAAWFAVKGDPSRARVKQLPRKKGPAQLFLDVMDGNFSPWGKGFIKFPSTMFVADKFTMVTAASGSDHDCITRCAVSRGCKTVNVLDQGGQTICQMFTARGGYPGAHLKAAEHSTMYELEYIP